jgi:hypothetical protein
MEVIATKVVPKIAPKIEIEPFINTLSKLDKNISSKREVSLEAPAPLQSIQNATTFLQIPMASFGKISLSSDPKAPIPEVTTNPPNPVDKVGENKILIDNHVYYKFEPRHQKTQTKITVFIRESDLIKPTPLLESEHPVIQIPETNIACPTLDELEIMQCVGEMTINAPLFPLPPPTCVNMELSLSEESSSDCESDVSFPIISTSYDSDDDGDSPKFLTTALLSHYKDCFSNDKTETPPPEETDDQTDEDDHTDGSQSEQTDEEEPPESGSEDSPLELDCSDEDERNIPIITLDDDDIKEIFYRPSLVKVLPPKHSHIKKVKSPTPIITLEDDDIEEIILQLPVKVTPSTSAPEVKMFPSTSKPVQLCNKKVIEETNYKKFKKQNNYKNLSKTEKKEKNILFMFGN